jgi:uncharacterized protein (TIGR02099 family)
LSTILWGALVALIVVLAVYVSFGRLLMSSVGIYHTQILQHLNSRVPFHIEAQKVAGQLRSFSPEIVLTGLRISIPGSSEPPIELAEGRISFHPLESIGAWFPQISKLSLDGLSLKAERTPEGKWLISGLGSDDNATTDWLEELLLNIESVDLINNAVLFAVPDQRPQQLVLDLALRREGSERHMEANIRSLDHDATVIAIARGVGNPLKRDSFAGQLYFDIKAQDIAPFQSLFSSPPQMSVEGGIDTQVWLAWNSGEFTFEFTLDGKMLEVSAADKSWTFPMQALSLQARVLNDKEHWTVDASEMSLSKGGTTLNIPRLNLVNRGDSLHLLAADVPLAGVNAMLVDMALTPEAIADVFAVLNTRGLLSSLQLDLADINQPLKDWHLAANFQDFKVDSWRGAPGLTEGRGYVALNPGSGQVIIDSQSFAMSYPTVYREALAYDDFYGTVDLAWDESDFTLSSGLMTATAEEGITRVLFALNVPLSAKPVGLEMDLLVGLQDFDPSYRSKYLPYTLSEGLLGWLELGIEKGKIEQGAFLWRGSLTPEKPGQKTVQLFFNVADTTLDYHRDWPPVTQLNGTVLIDDTKVSVWADSARLYDSKISHLSAETWLNASKHMMLAIDGQLSGDASDGLSVVNQSPLAKLVGSTFTNWSLAGQLDTHLQLTLNIGDSASEPQIDVATTWGGVDLSIEPGGLVLEAVSGQLIYSTAGGFSSKNVVGSLWGQPVKALIRQVNADKEQSTIGVDTATFDAKKSAIIVDLSTRVAMSDVQSWLKLDELAFAQGESDVAIEIEVTPGKGALLSIDSVLEGTKLNLPKPWHKVAGQSMPLHIETSLGEGSLLTRLTLANSLYLDIDQREGALAGMNLGFYQPPKKVQPGWISIGGHLPMIEVEQWLQFVDDYIKSDVLASFEQSQGLSVKIEKLQADTLLIAGQDLRDVVFDLVPEAGGWLLSAETGWLAGQFSFAHADQNPRLDIRYLDISQLDKLNFENLETETVGRDVFEEKGLEDVSETAAMPDLKVVLQGIYQGPDLLGSLNFTLHHEAEAVSALNISGELAGLTLAQERPAKLIWAQGNDADETRLNAAFEFEDLGGTLQTLGFQKTLETENGLIVVDLEWPGGPQNFSLASAMGAVTAGTGEGRFLNAPAGASGALRVVSILNLADIIGRVSLSHMFESGVSFHAIDAELFLQDGKIEVASMDVEGSSSGYQFSGVADVAMETLDGNLVVVLPVANNLPWVVALAAGLPVAAGVFVMSQVFKEQVNRFSSGVYRISGPWVDPSVEFVRIFDDSAKKKSAANLSSSSAQAVEQEAAEVTLMTTDPNTQERVADPNTPVALEDT